MQNNTNILNFFAAGGEMGQLIRQYDWTLSPLGHPEKWPQSLRLTIRLMLNSQHPMFIWWGPDLIQFYNDAYRATMGPAMHPMALGARGRESWSEIWPVIGPQIEHVMSGKGATWNVEQLVPINRNGEPENVWWTYGYSPIDFEDGIGGVLVVCSDVTSRHLLTERLKNQTQHLQHLFEQAPGFIATLTGPEHEFEYANASYRKLLGDRDMVGKTVREAVPESVDQGFIELLDGVYRSGKPYIGRRTPIMLHADPSQPPQHSFLDFIYQPINAPDGSITGIFVEGQDVTDHVLAEERLSLINAELRHRVKNSLTVFQAIATQSLKNVKDSAPVVNFINRLANLGRAHDTLLENNWGATEMHLIASATVLRFGLSERINVSGSTLQIGPYATLSFSMILQELITNAAKYGSLSVERGRVDLSWRIEGGKDDDFALINWQERGGPPVKLNSP
jgi:two-component sensor histidine kinase